MNKKEHALNAVIKQGILPLYFHADSGISNNVLKALYEAGIRAIEYTNRGDAALTNFAAMKELRDSEMKDLLLGIGTIKNRKDAQAFVDAGADFLISPGYIPEVYDVANENGLLWIPGCMTPSEIIVAENAGINFVKLFPGNVLGIGFLEAIKPLFPTMHFMPTGGVDLEKENIDKWFKAGVSAVGLGSKLINKAVLDQDDYKTVISALTQKAICIIDSIRK